MGIKVPDYSYLTTPYKVEGIIWESKKSFYELALKRVRYLSANEHIRFEKDVFWDDYEISTAVYILDRNNVITSEWDEEIFVNALDISVNKDAFYLNGEDYTDLIPYAVEHEIYEIWLFTKKGLRVQNSKMRHLLARRRQFEMAHKDWKIDRLMDFYKKINNTIDTELEYAYRKAKQKI